MKKTLLLAGMMILGKFLFAQTWTTPGNGTIYTSTTTTKVGIGTTTPGSPLDVVGTIHSAGNMVVDETSTGAIGAWLRGASTGDANIVMQANAGGGNAFWITADPYNLKIGAYGGTEASVGMINCTFGNTVGINTTDTKGYTFAVAGSAIFTQAVVKLQANWPDFVFSRNYLLPSLDSVAGYIKTNHHLPGIPTSAEVQAAGVDLGATQAKLLEKIEELTLYTIDMRKEMDSLKAENQRLENIVTTLVRTSSAKQTPVPAINHPGNPRLTQDPGGLP